MLWAILAAAPLRCACRQDGTGWKPATHAASMHALSARQSIACCVGRRASSGTPVELKKKRAPTLRFSARAQRERDRENVPFSLK
jgi:hypothetical protein